MIEPKNFGMKSKGSSDPSTQIKSSVANLRSGDGGVRQEAREKLTSIGKQAVGQLIPLLKDPEADVRWEAAKALSEIADPLAAPELVAILEDPNFGVRWLAAEGLIVTGRDALGPLMEALTKRSESAWLREGAHHVLHDLSEMDLEVNDLVAPVIVALEGTEPEIGVMNPAYAALDKLKVSIKLKRGKPQEGKTDIRQVRTTEGGE